MRGKYTFMRSKNKLCTQHEIYLRAMGGRIAVRPEREISHRKGMKSGFVGAPPFSLLPKLVAWLNAPKRGLESKPEGREKIMRCINSGDAASSNRFMTSAISAVYFVKSQTSKCYKDSNNGWFCAAMTETLASEYAIGFGHTVHTNQQIQVACQCPIWVNKEALGTESEAL